MIIVKLMGGLGNQMFQYATARRIALQNHTQLYLDLDWYNHIPQSDTQREYELNCFNIQAKTLYSTSNLNISTNNTFVKRIISLFKRQKNIKVIQENQRSYDSNILITPDNSLLIGFWQSEKYFLDIRKQLLNDFSWTTAPDKQNAHLLKQIKMTNSSISVHVRRGDYVNNNKTKTFHGLLGLDYYQLAIKCIANKIKDPVFYIFSDDSRWCKKNLFTNLPVIYIDHNIHGSDDLRLMKECRHHIIANSSFSWWGAWLCTYQDKVVVAPRKWFTDENINTDDIIPSNWIRL